MTLRTNGILKKRSLLSVLMASMVAGAFSLGAAAPSFADDNNDEMSALVNNGYNIVNKTGEELILRSGSIRQGKEVCKENYDEPNQFYGYPSEVMCDQILGKDFTVNPPTSIANGRTGYFEIKAYRCTPFVSFAGYTLDSTELVYETKSGKSVTLFANVIYGWGMEFCIPGIADDDSEVTEKVGLQAGVKDSEGKGTQTVFSIAGFN